MVLSFLHLLVTLQLWEWKGAVSQKKNALHLRKDILFDYVDITEIFLRFILF